MLTKQMTFSYRLMVFGLILTLFPAVVSSQVNVTHLTESNAVSDKDGIIYSLPRTVIKVSLVVNKIQRIKGPYAEFADKYLGLTSIIANNSTEYELRDVSLNTIAEADPEQFYFVEIGAKSSGKKKIIELYLSQAGFLQDASDIPTLKKLPRLERSKTEKPSNGFADILNPSLLDTLIRKDNADTTNNGQTDFRKISETDPEKKAKDAAEIIFDLDEKKLNLLSGDQEVGFGTNLSYMCNQLEAMKAQYLALFKGITSVTVTTLNLSFTPKPGETKQEITLGKFSKSNGFVGNTDSGGDPVSIVLESQGLTRKISRDEKSNKSGDKHGFSYRIPDNAKIAVYVGGLSRLETIVSVNQLGVISSLPARNISSLQMHPGSGGIKHIILE